MLIELLQSTPTNSGELAQIYISPKVKQPGNPRLFVSSGVMGVRDLPFQSLCLCSDAIVPREPWNLLEASDYCSMIQAGDKINWSRFVALVSIKTALFRDLQSSGLDNCDDYESFECLQAKPQFKRSMKKLVDHILQRFTASADGVQNSWLDTEMDDLITVRHKTQTIRGDGVSVAASNRFSTSLNRALGCYVGLHVTTGICCRYPSATCHETELSSILVRETAGFYLRAHPCNPCK